jgi:hypothetical protein
MNKQKSSKYNIAAIDAGSIKPKKIHLSPGKIISPPIFKPRKSDAVPPPNIGKIKNVKPITSKGSPTIVKKYGKKQIAKRDKT